MLNKQGGGIKNLMDQSLYEEKKLDTLVILVRRSSAPLAFVSTSVHGGK